MGAFAPPVPPGAHVARANTNANTNTNNKPQNAKTEEENKHKCKQQIQTQPSSTIINKYKSVNYKSAFPKPGATVFF